MTYDERQTAACDAVRTALRVVIKRAQDALNAIGSDPAHDAITDVLRSADVAAEWNDRILRDEV